MNKKGRSGPESFSRYRFSLRTFISTFISLLYPLLYPRLTVIISFRILDTTFRDILKAKFNCVSAPWGRRKIYSLRIRKIFYLAEFLLLIFPEQVWTVALETRRIRSDGRILLEGYTTYYCYISYQVWPVALETGVRRLLDPGLVFPGVSAAGGRAECQQRSAQGAGREFIRSFFGSPEESSPQHYHLKNCHPKKSLLKNCHPIQVWGDNSSGDPKFVHFAHS